MNPVQIELETETRKQIIAVYDELYYYMLEKPDEIWETEALANTLQNEERYQTLSEMLLIYKEEEDYNKCAIINQWINALNATYSMISIREECIK